MHIYILDQKFGLLDDLSKAVNKLAWKHSLRIGEKLAINLPGSSKMYTYEILDIITEFENGNPGIKRFHVKRLP